MKHALAISIGLLLCGPTVASAKYHHPQRHHRNHRHHSAVARPGASAIKTVDTEAGPIRVAAAYAERFVGFINALVADGYKPKEIGCFAARGHMPHSKHHWGGACDIDQRSRNKTAARMYHVTELAHQFKLTDGCEWRNPDCGHVEVPGGTRVAHHRRRHYAKAGE